jgi:hypothetical protein
MLYNKYYKYNGICKLMSGHNCINCNKEVKSGKAGSVVSSNNMTEVVCKACSKFTRSALSLHEVAIIPITKERFDNIVLKYGVYYHPMKYSRKGGRYLAFYITHPVSAITHFAKVTKISLNQPLNNLPGNNLFEYEPTSLQKVYFLEEVKEIMPIVKKDNRTIQGTILTTLKDLKKAKNTKELIIK